MLPGLQEASVDTRLIEIARPDDKGAAQSTLAERSTVAELWVNRSWALSQRWDAAAPGAWKAEGITPSDTDVARGAVVEAGVVNVWLTNALKPLGYEIINLGGGRNPIKRFETSMETAGTSEHQKQRFYCDNFIDLMGAGLAPELRHPVQAAA